MSDSRISKLTIAVLVATLSLSLSDAQASTMWNWNYSGTGISAGGFLLTTDAPDASGYYQILSITGSRNGIPIVNLYPTGQAIPGNEPYKLDNLIRVDGPGQISVHGFGFSLTSGAYVNPYFADFLSPPAYSEVFTQGSTFSELPITFSANPVPVLPAIVLFLSGLGVLAFKRPIRCRDAHL